MNSDSDSDIELVLPDPSRAAAPTLRTSPLGTALHAPSAPALVLAGPPSSSSSVLLPPPLSQRHTQGRVSSPPGPSKAATAPPSDIIEIGSDDDDDDGVAPGRALLSVPAPRRTASAPARDFPSFASTSRNTGTSRLINTRNTRRNASDTEEDEELPEIGSIGFRRTVSDSNALAAVSYTPGTNATYRPDKGKGKQRQRDPSTPPTPPLPSSSSTVFQPYSSRPQAPRCLTANSNSTARLQEPDNDSDDEPPKKRNKNAAASAPSGSSAPSGLTKTQLKEAERIAKKAEKDREKAEKAAALAKEKESRNAIKSSNKLGDRKAACTEISVEISETLLSDEPFFGEKILVDLAARYQELECAHSLVKPDHASGCHTNVIHWRRKVTKDWDARRRYWVPRRDETEYTSEEQDTVLIYLSGQEVEQCVGTMKRTGQLAGTLLDVVKKARAAHAPHYQVFLLIQGLEGKRSSKQSGDNASWQAECNGSSAATKKSKKKAKWDASVKMDEVLDEIVRCTIAERCFVVRAETKDEAVDWLVELTKDVAYKPYKLIERARDALLNIDGKIEPTNGGNLLTTYINQLACITGVTEAAARAIAERYPSWKRLMYAYRQCYTDQEKKDLLKGIAVGNRTDGAATDKKIGKAVSERVYIVLFTPDKNLDLTGDLKAVRARIDQGGLAY